MNAGVLQRGLCRQVGPIQGGEVESLLLDFERPRGEQSNPLATVVADVILTCDTERGPGLPLDAGQPYHLCIRSLIVPCTLVDDRAEGGVEVSEERESKGRQEEARAKQGLGILYARGEAEDRLGGRQAAGHPSRTERTVLDAQSGRRRYREKDLDRRNQYAAVDRAP